MAHFSNEKIFLEQHFHEILRRGGGGKKLFPLIRLLIYGTTSGAGVEARN